MGGRGGRREVWKEGRMIGEGEWREVGERKGQADGGTKGKALVTRTSAKPQIQLLNT